MPKPPTTHRTPTPNVPVGHGDEAPAGDGAQTDPTPAATPVASADLNNADGDRAGAGRPTATDHPRDHAFGPTVTVNRGTAEAGQPPRKRKGKDRTPAKRTTPPTSADLAQILLDADADTWLDKAQLPAGPRIPAMSADLVQALLDADAETWRTDNALRTERVRAFAVEFDDRARHARGEAS